MNSEADEPIVIRRSRGRNRKDISKRVSFDAGIFNVDEDDPIGATSVETKAVELGYSRKVFKEELENEKSDSPRNLSSGTSSKSTPKRYYPSLMERGVPEGQEDPKMYSSTSNLSDLSRERRPKSTYFLDDRSQNSKDLLVRKFLKSIPTKRVIPKYDLSVTQSRIHRLHVPISNLKRSDIKDHSTATKALSDEAAKNAPRIENIASRLKSSLIRLVASPDTESTVYKAYKVLDIEGAPALAVITSESLRFVGYDDASGQFILRYSCAFENLLAAVIGPFSQLVIVFDECEERYFVNTGVSQSIASELISHLEVAIRRWCTKARKEFSFNVAQIYEMKQMGVFHELLPDNAFVENEVVIAQYTVWLQEDYVESSSPLGPEKEGYLMTKIEKQSTWLPLYVCLKGGVLYLFDKNSQRIPKFAIPLCSSYYNGCRIHNDSERPHTFEILLEKNSTFHFGAADELEMMEWIRNIYSSASQMSNVEMLDCEKESPIVNCFVTLSSNQILLHRFPNEIISRAFLNNVTSFTKSSWPKSYYCLLELCCREASEMGGDWILYFVSEDSFKSFCSIFAEINNHSLTTYQVEDERFLTHKSDRISAKINASWDSFFV